MLLPCEVAVRSLVPALRSAIARELIQEYGLKQKDAANLLGVTQTAVSKYIRHIRGVTIQVEDVTEIQPTLKEIVTSLANGDLSKYQLVTKICRVCKILRKKGLMCGYCKISDPSIEIQNCPVCNSDTNSRSPEPGYL